MGGASPPRSLGFNSRATVTHFPPLCNTDLGRERPISQSDRLQRRLSVIAAMASADEYPTPEQVPAPSDEARPRPRSPAAPIDDANDLRGYHFKRLMRKPVDLDR